MIDGFVAANSNWVHRVPGGVVRARRTPPRQVAVVIGGGSGHYPAFAGLVGPGLAAGAAIGNTFASPSAQQIYSVAKAADTGGGVLLTFGNYAGDVMNFAQAQDRLRRDGIDCRTVIVTDDIASAGPGERHRRRGIAGDLIVFKAAGAAAEAGMPLEEVVNLAMRANESTRSFGVAFAGCTLPGASEPLFSVPDGRMALGLGIHGEPGIGEADLPTADDLAELLVSRLLTDLPDDLDSVDGHRSAALLNGLGSVKYEELFVVYRRIAYLLAQRGITVVEPEVGEFCTSFDMAGVSLTLSWLDEELEALWSAPADTPSYRKGNLGSYPSAVAVGDGHVPAIAAEAGTPITPATLESQRAARVIVSALQTAAAVIDGHADELGRIDSVAGDGDHGLGMTRGIRAALAAGISAAESGAGAGLVLERAGDAWADRAGGTSGALWGIILRSVAVELGNEKTCDAACVSRAVSSATEAVMRFGGAKVGDKTMIDALVPFSESMQAEAEQGATLAQAWTAAAAAASIAAERTANLLPRMGRARPHAEKSLGTPDAGAHSLALIAKAVADVLMDSNKEHERA